MASNIPEELKKYDTPEARQAYSSSMASSAPQSDHGNVPQQLWSMDTPEARKSYTLTKQMNEGLMTSDNRLFQLTPDQVSWVTQKYQKTWEYGHDALDQEAKAMGALPPSLYSKYKDKKSAYDAWALQAGMPNEKDLEKYLKEYDDWKVQYAADAKAFDDALTKRESQEKLLESFYNDVADRLYKAEFKGVQRGSNEWNQIYFDTLNDPQYAALGDYYSGIAGAEVAAAAKKKKSSSTEESESLTPEGAYIQSQVTRRAAEKQTKDAADKLGVPSEPTQAEIDAIVEEKGYYFPPVPDISFSLSDFTAMYDRNVTASETEHGYGKINGAVRDAAVKIGYTNEGSAPVSPTNGPRVSETGSAKSGRSGSFGTATESTPGTGMDAEFTNAKKAFKVAKQTDVAAYCKDLALGGYNSDEFYAVMSGLTAGSQTSKNPYGPGFYFDTATQEQVYRYGDVVATRFGTDLLNLVINDASDEELQAYISKAVSQGATQELLTRAYDTAIAALGGYDEDDTSRDWDGLSYKERKKRDEKFQKRFQTALQAAPSIPIGSGWTGKYKTKEDVDKIVALRGEFDLKENAKKFGLSTLNQDVQSTPGAGSNYGHRPSPEEFQQATSKITQDSAAKLKAFREAALEHGYSEWEIGQFLMANSYSGGFTLEGPNLQAYREFLIESSWGDPFALEQIEMMSDGDLNAMSAYDSRVNMPKQMWAYAPVMACARGVIGYAQGVINFFDMLANGGDSSGKSGEIAESLNLLQNILSTTYRRDNQSGFVAWMTDAGAEIFRMYLVAKTGGVFGKAVGGALNFVSTGSFAATSSAATWLAGGSKAAELVKWGIESVPFITGAMGSSYAEARAEGATNREAAAYGVLAGIVEGLTEKISVELMIGDGGNKLINKAVSGLMKSGAKGLLKGVPGIVTVNVMKILGNALVEGQQEGASYLLDLPLKKTIYNSNAKFSWGELFEQAGMGALCGALGLAFQNYGASYVNSMMEFALSSPKNMQTFGKWAMNQYGASLGTDGNYVVKAEDYDPTKILPASEWNEAWKNYIDASASLAAAQKQYEATVASLDEDDAQKARDVMYWKNQIAAGDPNDATSANAMVHAMEQLTLAESKQADTAKKNARLRQDARTELNNARKRAQNTMTEASAKIRAHSRSEIAATLSVTGDAAALDSNYDLAQTDDTDPARKRFDNARAYAESVGNAISALDALETSTGEQREAQAKSAQEATNTFLRSYKGSESVKAAVASMNDLTVAKESGTAEFSDSWYATRLDEIDAEDVAAYQAYRAGELTWKQYEAVKAKAAEDITTALIQRDASRARELQAQAESVRNIVVRALALQTQETATEALDAVVISEDLLSAEQREALTDELNRIVAGSIMSDEAMQNILDAFSMIEDQMQQKPAGWRLPQSTTETASEAQKAAQAQTEGKTLLPAKERQEQLQRAQAIGKMLGVDVRIVEDLPNQIAGRYESGVCYINQRTENAPMRVFVHELTHYLEGTLAYSRLQNYVFGTMNADPHFSLGAEIASYRAMYAEVRAEIGETQLSDADAEAEAKAEIVARWCEKNLFTNEQSINNLTASRQSLGKRILNGIQRMLSGKRTNAASAELRAAEKLYIRALNRSRAFGGAKVERKSTSTDVKTVLSPGSTAEEIYKAATLDQQNLDNQMHEVADKLEIPYENGVQKKVERRDVKYDLTELGDSDRRYVYLASRLEAGDNSVTPVLQDMVDAAASSAGYTIKAYHGTRSKFESFKGTSEMGYHFGTKAAARGRVGTGKGTEILPVYLRIQNPITFDYDLGSWDANYRLADELNRLGIISDQDLTGVRYVQIDGRRRTRSDASANRELQNLLKSKGYDSLKYRNTLESRPSWSYIVFDPAQIKSAELITYDTNGDRISLSERFNEGETRFRYALSGDVEARLAELRKQYGSMTTPEHTETAPGRENVVLPTQTNDDTYVRRAAQTFMRSPNVTDAAASDIGRAVLRGEFNYERQTNAQTESNAAQRIIDLGGQEAALKHLEDVANRHSAPSAETVAIGERLILDAQAVGDVNAFEKAVVYTAMIGTAAGQTVQAFSMINKLSPQGIALYMNRVIERLNNVEYKDLIAKGKMKPIELTEDQIARILGVHSFSDATRVQTEILTEIAQQIPLTMKEQLRSWRYLCMLGNVRTNVRNIAGNLAMASMRSGKDVIAAGLEAWDVKRGQRLEQKAAEAAQAGDTARAEKLRERADRHLAQSDRTKALGIGANADAFRANKAYARGTLADAETLLKGGGKDVGLSVLREEKRMFNNKALNKIGKAALAPLDLFDMKFLAPQYVNAYASWVTARGLTGENMTLKQRNEAMTYAVSEAQKATFRDANWLATKLTEIRSRNLATELVVGGIMPFAKTPANVLRRGIEYSPAGILQGFAQIYKANNDSTLSQADRMKLRAEAIDRLASGTTGTGLLAIGIALRALGVLRGKDDDDSRASKFFRDMGRQAYSFQIGGTSITLDWLAPVNMPMFMGVAVYDVAEQLAGGEDLDWKDIAEPLLSIADPMIEMSMLSGIQSALKTYGSENALSAVATNTLQSFAGQFYPTIGGQLAQTIDTTRRAPDSKHYWIQSMMAKIPGVSKLMKPYVGGYGEEEEFEPTDSAAANYILRGIEQFISPGYIKTERNDELTTELARLYESTGVNKFLPQRPSDYKQLNLGKEYGTIDLTQEEQVEYEKLFRSEAAKALDAAVKAPEYRGLSDADKADLLCEVYTAATKEARKQYKQKMIERYHVAATAPKK